MTTPYALIFGPADVSHMMADMQQLYAHHPQVRTRFEHIASVADVSVAVILRQAPIPDGFSCMQVVSLGLLAGMLGIADSVVAQRGEPCCAGGISLGEVAALCASGALTIADAVALIHLRVDRPETEDETVGFVLAMQEGDRDFYHQPPEMRISVDYGLIQQGVGSLLMVSGLRRMLEGKGQEGPGMLEVLPPSLCQSAYHTPYRQRIAQQVHTYLETKNVFSPRYPIVTCLDGLDVVNDPDGVKVMSVRSETERLSVPAMIQQIQRLGAVETVCIGPFLRSLNMDFGMPASFRDEKWVAEIYPAPLAI
ncbi:hypothetical protein PEC301937_13990 [Pectobacterium carotovorum subsp. carotovorum]|nr:hypothetical protein PEC301937_13990 [Pectobacterium carotovorum subsp. carotovorum]